jgi:integrase/recombinase XerC
MLGGYESQELNARRGGSGTSTSVTVTDSVAAFLDAVRLSRSPNTARTYANALGAFLRTIRSTAGDPQTLSCQEAQERWIADFATHLKRAAPATERLYLAAARAWFEYLTAEGLADVNLSRLRQLIRQRARRPGQRLPQFPRQAIEAMIAYAARLKGAPYAQESEHQRNLRDRALLLTLADTGLRVHEACALRRGDLDWHEAHALMIGKGNRQAIVRFSRRSLEALRDYLASRAALDGGSGRPLPSLPVFARHDKAAGKRVLPISTTTGRAIVHQRAAEALGDRMTDVITPHAFRHYFVTAVLRGSGGNLKLAQELARHRSITVTQRYAHLSDDELDRGYAEIFDQGEAEPESR